MTYLLDTHTLIWALTDPQRLSDTVKAILEDTENELVVSAISFWEIALKHSIQKLTLDGLTPEDFPRAALETGFRVIELNAITAASYHQLAAAHHRDPFDRMLIWQALQNNFKLISKDTNVLKYTSEGLAVVW
jgi:PIN domain nuclease of toxin-antitoxin system